LPAAPSTSGDAPQLALSYDSGSVDGITSHENNQSSSVGLGWDLGVPFLEHKLKPCTDEDKAGHLCWGGGVTTLSMAGHTGRLVYLYSLADRDVYRLSDDQGWRVEQVFAGASANPNSDVGGVYWRVVTTDGTSYYFGRENAAWSNGPNNSTLTVPMYAQSDQDLCWYDTLKDAAGNDVEHACRIGYRWNLAYVVDPEPVKSSGTR